VKTGKDLDGSCEDVETQRTCQGGLEFFHLSLEEIRAQGLRGQGRLQQKNGREGGGNGRHHPNPIVKRGCQFGCLSSPSFARFKDLLGWHCEKRREEGERG